MMRATPARSPRRRLLTYQARLKGVGFLFVLPAVVFFMVFFLYPVSQAVRVSFTSWNLFTPAEYNGYASTLVPRALQLPPYHPSVGDALVDGALALLNDLGGTE